MKVLSSNSIGAIIDEVHLDFNGSAEEKEIIQQLKSLLYKHKVISIKNQHLSLEQFDLLCTLIGRPRDVHSVAFKDKVENYTPIPVEGFPNLIYLHRKPNAKNEEPLFGRKWHSDMSFLSKPPDFTVLYSLIIPPMGGETFFADQVAAYEQLDKDKKEFINSKKGLHSFDYGFQGWDNKITHQEYSSSCFHDMVKVHPVTQEKALFVNEGYFAFVEGMNKEESDKLTKELYEYQTQLDFFYKLSWEANMVTIWDNRVVLHRATAGYEGYERKMVRALVDDN